MSDPRNEERFITCRCQHCDGHIEFETYRKGEAISCPHCGLETSLYVPATPIATHPSGGASVPPLVKSDKLTIGDIVVSPEEVITPNGVGPLVGSQWTCMDRSAIVKRMPASAIILTVIFFLVCFLGLLFLLIHEQVITGYVEVSVRTGNIYHVVQIPVSGEGDANRLRQVAEVREKVSRAQAMAAHAAH
jgi:hypothetical protein